MSSRWRSLSIVLAVLVVPAIAGALQPATEVWIPAAARVGPWRTDLYLLNPGDADAVATLSWLVRGQPNPQPASVTLTVPAGRSLPLVDVIGARFGLARGEGALRIVADRPLVATSRIRAETGAGSVGQGFDGVPAAAATPAGATSHVQGIADDAGFRSNLYALAGADGAELGLAVVTADGAQVATADLTLGAWQPYLERLPAVFGPLEVRDGVVRVTVRRGSAVAGASRVDLVTTDPTTLAGWVEPTLTGGPAVLHGVVVAVPGGPAGALAVRLDEAGEVVGLELSYPSERCGAVFSAGEDLSRTPLPLATLAEGHRLVSSFTDGAVLTWTLTLQPAGPLGWAGTVSAGGAGFSGAAAGCNGEHGPRAVRLGIE